MARPRQPLITPETCATAALAVIDEEGLGALSLERLARELSVKSPSLYHHFTDKAAILAAVVDLVLLEVPVPPQPLPGGWIEWFVQICVGFRRTILAHPNAAPLLLEHYPGALRMAAYDRASRVLHRAGIPLERHIMILDGLDKLTLGSGLYRAALSGSGQAEFGTVDPERDLMLARALEANPWGDEEVFAETVRAVLRGVRTEVG